MALTELLKRGYSKDIAIGSLAGAGTLGFLIPPSNILIIYGVLGDVSIVKLFTAGFIPGALLAGCFMAWVMIHTTLAPRPVPESRARAQRNLTLLDRIRALKELAPAIFLIGAVLGSMYGGIATPSESAAVGVLGALIVAALQGGLTLKALRDIAMGSVMTCSMIAMILLGASILGSAAAFLGIPRAIADFVAAMGLSPFGLIVVLIGFYLILGCFLDGFSMIVLTLPIVLPIVKQAGFDPVWFGIFLVLVVEMAQITPPVGFNLFVIQGLTGDGLGYIARVTLPYLVDHGAVHAADHGIPRHRAVAAQPAGGALASVFAAIALFRARRHIVPPEEHSREAEMAKFGIGQAVRRVEDARFLTGIGALCR